MNKHLLIPTVIFCSLLSGLSGCVQTYGPEDTWHLGYTNSQIDHNTFSVSFDGQSYTSRQDVQNMLLYRCAELTWQNGYDYFIVMGLQISEKHDQDCNYTYDTKNKKHNWSVTTGDVDCQDVVSYSGNAVIKAYKGKKPANNPSAYNANELMMYLNSQIKK